MGPSFALTRAIRSSGACALLALLSACAHHAPPGPDLRAQTQDIVSGFVSAVQAQGLSVPAVPTVHVETTPNLIFYADQTVTVPRWSDLPAPVQGLFSEWAAAAGGGWDGEGLFDALFHWFLVPHELGHFVDELRGVSLSHHAAELRANRVAVAWWARDPAQAARLEDFCAVATTLMGVLPDPVPAGEDPAAWFDAHYDALAQDPVAYGHYQFQFMATACAERAQYPFDTLLGWP